MNVGFELPNRSDGTVTAEEWVRFAAIGGKVAKVRPYHLTVANLDALSAFKPTIILRPNSDGDFDVADRYGEIRAALAMLLQWPDLGPIIVIPDNEPNLGNRPVPDGYWNAISNVVASLQEHLTAGVLIASPPMAVMQGEEAWYAAATEAGSDLSGSLLDAFDYVSVHLYGQCDTGLVARSLQLASQYGVPLLADEIGDSHETASREQKAAALASYIRLAGEFGVAAGALFILGENGDWPGFVTPTDLVRSAIRPVVEAISAP